MISRYIIQYNILFMQVRCLILRSNHIASRYSEHEASIGLDGLAIHLISQSIDNSVT